MKANLKQGVEKMREITCHGIVTGRTFRQEHFETASKDAGQRAKVLRKAGFNVDVSALGPQVTNVGIVKMTMVTISNPNENVPEVNVVRI